MTDDLLQKLEEKMVTLLTELENMRSDLNRIKQENFSLRAEQANHTKKLQGLVSLLDVLDSSSAPSVTHELQLLQGKEDFVTA